LTKVFLMLVFLSATQDIAVDGKNHILADRITSLRMGADAAVGGKLVVCFDITDDWTEHGLLFIIHRLLGLKLAHILVISLFCSLLISCEAMRTCDRCRVKMECCRLAPISSFGHWPTSW
jgi:hypothetical protein